MNIIYKKKRPAIVEAIVDAHYYGHDIEEFELTPLEWQNLFLSDEEKIPEDEAGGVSTFMGHAIRRVVP